MAEQIPLNEFGAQIKQKYPAYSQYGDEEIGRKMLEKYPIYMDRVLPAAPKLSAQKIADQESAQKYGATFAANTQNANPIAEAAKTVGNIPKSAFGFVKGALDLINPISTIKKIGQIGEQFGGLRNDLAQVQKANEQNAASQNQLIAKWNQKKAAGEDTSHLDKYFASAGINPGTPAVAKKAPSAFGMVAKSLPGATYESLVPEAGRALVTAAGGYIKGDDAQIDRGLGTAQRAITNDPVGSILPFLLAAKGATKLSDSAGFTRNASGAFDTGISKTASVVTKPAAYVFDKAKSTVSKTTRFATGQATGLNPETISQIKANPEAFSKSNMAGADRSALGRRLQADLDRKMAEIEETGSGYQPIRELKGINKDVFPGTQKVIKEGPNSIVYELTEAPNKTLSLPELRQKANLMKQNGYPQAEIGSVLDDIAKREIAEPVPHKVKVNPNYLKNSITKTTGLTMKDGKLVSSGTSRIRDPRDIRALENHLKQWEPEFKKGYLTPEEFLNYRHDIGKLSKFERDIGKSMDVENVAKEMYAKLNETHRKKIPGLEELDAKFSPLKEQYREITKGLVDRDGNLTPSAIDRIANASGNTFRKGELLKRLEDASPGITKQIQILKAIEDIQHASGIKVGTYSRGAIIGAGFLTSGPVGAIINAILTSPEMAVPLLRTYGLIENSAVVRAVVEGLKKGAKNVNELPEGNFMPKLSKPSAFAPRDQQLTR